MENPSADRRKIKGEKEMTDDDLIRDFFAAGFAAALIVLSLMIIVAWLV